MPSFNTNKLLAKHHKADHNTVGTCCYIKMKMCCTIFM